VSLLTPAPSERRPRGRGYERRKRDGEESRGRKGAKNTSTGKKFRVILNSGIRPTKGG